MANIRNLQNIPNIANSSADNPRDIESFVAWLSKYHGYDHRRYNNYYGLAVDKLERSLEDSPFWKDLTSFLPNVNTEYQERTGNQLLDILTPPTLNKKTLSSVIQKAYRKDVLQNSNFPEMPDNGTWILPENWFTSLNDILRTTVIVRYLDGVEFLLNRLKEYTIAHGCGFSSDYEARENGYYAAHTGVQIELYMPQYEDLALSTVRINLEIQITTQLQSVVKDLLHIYYEKDRISGEDNSYIWQWDYRSDRFSTNYLGHMVHFIEGLVVGLRDKQHQQK